MEKEHDVHIFAVVRIKIPRVKANSALEAIPKALEEAGDLDQVLSRAEYADEISHYLVDESDDSEHQHSTWFLDAEHWDQVRNQVEDGVRVVNSHGNTRAA